MTFFSARKSPNVDQCSISYTTHAVTIHLSGIRQNRHGISRLILNSARSPSTPPVPHSRYRHHLKGLSALIADCRSTFQACEPLPRNTRSSKAPSVGCDGSGVVVVFLGNVLGSYEYIKRWLLQTAFVDKAGADFADNPSRMHVCPFFQAISFLRSRPEYLLYECYLICSCKHDVSGCRSAEPGEHLHTKFAHCRANCSGLRQSSNQRPSSRSCLPASSSIRRTRRL